MYPIIIIGMHRSGTSLLTELLRKAGVFVGNDVDDNFESQFFCQLNDWSMSQAGATWDNPYNMQFIDDFFIAHIQQNFNKHIHSKRIKKFGKKLSTLENFEPGWGWKDPRNTFTHPVWQRIFPDARLLHIYRNPVDVAQSLRKREQKFRTDLDSQTRTGFRKKYNERYLTHKRLYSQSLRIANIYEGIKLWEQYTGAAMKIEQNILHVSYENLLSSPEIVLKQVLNYLDCTPTIKIDSLTGNINADRKYAFLKNPELVEVHEKIKNNQLVKKLDYNQIT